MITEKQLKQFKDWGLEYLVPINEKTKKPIPKKFYANGKTEHHWKLDPRTEKPIKYSDEELLNAWGVGVSLAPCRMIGIDGDAIESSDYMSEFPETLTIGKKVNGKTLIRQKIYKVDEDVQHLNFGKGTDEGTVIELLSHTQSVLTGGNRIIYNNVQPKTLSKHELERVKTAMRKVYAWSMLTRHYPEKNKGQRDEYVLAVVGTLVTQTNWDTEERKNFLEKLLRVNNDTEEFRNRLNKIDYQEKQHDKGITIAGVPALTKLIGADAKIGLPFVDAIKPEKKPKRKELVTLKLGEFLLKEYPKEFYLQFPLVATGKLVQVWANAGHGKTWFCLELACAIANGQNFLKYKTHEKAEPYPVLYVEGEMGVAELQKRLLLVQDRYCNKQLRFNHHNFEIAPLKEQPEQNFESLTTPEGRANVENSAQKMFKEHGKKPFIFLDNITALTVMQEKEGADWVELVHWLTRLRAKGYTVWFLHHGTKTNQSASGSNLKERSIDMSIKLSIPPEDFLADLDPEQNTQMVVSWEKWREFNFTKWSSPFIANLNRPTTTWSIHPLLSGKQKKLKSLLDKGELSHKEIVEQVVKNKEMSRSQAYKLIKFLEKWKKENEDEKKS